MAAKRTKGPSFLRFVAPIVETLKELGNSGTAAEVADRVIDRLAITEEEQQATTSNGQSRVRNSKQIPALKIGRLAVDAAFRERTRGVGCAASKK